MKDRRVLKTNLMLIGLCTLFFIVSLAVGSVQIPLKEVFGSFFNRTLQSSYIVLNLRLPRSLGSVLCGAILGLSGVVFQAAFRNPMADPYILGVSSGSTFTVALSTFIGLAAQTYISLPLAAFLGGLGASLLTLLIAKKRPDALILSGVALSALFAALTSLLVYLNRNELSNVYFWTMGGFSSMSREKVMVLTPILLILWSVTSRKSRQLDLLLIDETSARSLGLVPERFRTRMLLLATAATSVAVGYSGTIGFAGILAPHIARLISGTSHRRFISTSALVGGTVLLLSDMAARTILSPSELPVGIITAMLGSPLFLYLALKRRKA